MTQDNRRNGQRAELHDTLIITGRSLQADQVVNATQMCKATGKLWGDYWRNEQTQAFLDALSANMGIPAIGLVFSKQGGKEAGGGTRVHCPVALHLAQWCSAEFAV